MVNRELMSLYNTALGRIESDLALDLISEEDAEFARESLINELEAANAEFAQEQGDVATFSAGNELGALLLEIGEKAEYEDPNDFLEDLSEYLDISIDDAYNLITSEEEFDEDTKYAVLDSFGLLDEEEGYEDDVEDEYEDDVEGEYEDDVEGEYEDDVEGEYEDDVVYSAYDSRINELENQLAEFQDFNVVKQTLNQLDQRARNLVMNGDMPSRGYDILFSNIADDDARVAAFSQLADSNGVSMEVELQATNKCLDFMERLGLGELGLFDDLVSEEELAAFGIEENPELDAEIEAIASKYTKRSY